MLANSGHIRAGLLRTASTASRLATFTSSLVPAFLLNRPSDRAAALLQLPSMAPLMQPTRRNSIINRRAMSVADGFEVRRTAQAVSGLRAVRSACRPVSCCRPRLRPFIVSLASSSIFACAAALASSSAFIFSVATRCWTAISSSIIRALSAASLAFSSALAERRLLHARPRRHWPLRELFPFSVNTSLLGGLRIFRSIAPSRRGVFARPRRPSLSQSRRH